MTVPTISARPRGTRSELAGAVERPDQLALGAGLHVHRVRLIMVCHRVLSHGLSVLAQRGLGAEDELVHERAVVRDDETDRFAAAEGQRRRRESGSGFMDTRGVKGEASS
jgi:hypothetical protein